MVLESSGWLWWQGSVVRHVEQLTSVFSQETDEEKLPWMHRMALILGGQERSGSPLSEMFCAVWMCVRYPCVPVQWPLKASLWYGEFQLVKAAHSYLLVCEVSSPYCTALCQASTVEDEFPPHLWRLRPWKHLQYKNSWLGNLRSYRKMILGHWGCK